MIQIGKIGRLAVASTGVFLSATHAYCGESGKIYSNGNWIDAKPAEEVSAWNNASIFGHKTPLDLRQLAIRFVETNARVFGARESGAWNLKSTQNGETFQTARLERRWNGLEVVGGDAVVNVENGKVAMATVDELHLGHLSAVARISGKTAQALAFASYRGGALSAENGGLKVLLVGENNEARLVYEVTVNDRDGLSSDVHFIDADRGEEVLVTTNVHTIRDRKVLSGVGSEDDFELEESKWKTIFADKGCSENFVSRLEDQLSIARRRPVKPKAPTARACNTVDAKVMASANSAWSNSGMVYDYYYGTHRRDSIDGRGMLLKSVVNFGDKFANAAWIKNKSLMIYGMGDDNELNDFAIALDVAGHELTHGVTSSTSALEYVSESGALNESYSDVFGKLVAFKNGKANDWKLGKELFRDGKRSIRDMEAPEVGHVRDMKYKGEPCSRMNDFCGVHTNSGVPNRAAVLIAKKLGQDKLGKLYYTVLTQMLRSTSNFREARAQTEAACAKLFGASSTDCAAVKAAFNTVGIQ